MRILQISSAKNYGGGEKHLVDLCRGLKEKKHEVFAALRKENEFEKHLDFLPPENRIHVPLRNSVDVLSAKTIAKFIRENKIEIVHAHLARDYPLASLAARLRPGSKLIFSRHVLFPMKNFHKLVLGNVSKVIAVSSAVEKHLEKVFPKRKIVCVPNGIEIGKWADNDHSELSRKFRFEHNIPFDAPLIGTVGELTKLKGQKDFVIAANEISKNISGTYFVVVGRDNSSDQNYKRNLKRLVEALDLKKQFIFIDWVEETAPLLSALDLFVSSSYSESFGLAILEAMASGTAVIATETAGARELLVSGNTGVLTPIKDAVEIAKSACELLEDNQIRENLRKNGQRFAKKNFNLLKMVDRTEKVYIDAMSL